VKIAFLVSSFPTVTETFIVNQISDLLDRGHEVKIFAFNRGDRAIVHDKIISYRLIEKTVYFHDFEFSKLKRFFPFLKVIITQFKNINFKRLSLNFHFTKDGFRTLNLRFFYKIKWILDEGDFDIFHTHFGQNGVYISEIRAKGFLARTKLVATFHGYDLTPSLLSIYRTKYKRLFQETDLLTVNTEYTKNLLRQIRTAKNVKILPVGLDTSEFKPKERQSDKFHLLFIGRLIFLKAPDVALEILRNLILKGFKNIKLTIIGTGELRESLIEYVKQHELETFVQITGPLSQEAVLDFMQEADILVMPGRYDEKGRAETQGLVIQEAQAMELPVIVSDAGGMKYGLIHGETGFVVKEGDIGSFVEKVEFLLYNESERIKMGRKGRQFIIDNYDSKFLGDQLEELYAGL